MRDFLFSSFGFIKELWDEEGEQSIFKFVEY